MRYASKTPWPPERWPTPDEFVAWFLSNDDEGRREIAEWAIRFGQESMEHLHCPRRGDW